ncbi:MAG: TVP38/TMEM64 family protein [Nitrospinae bacterium]|nr:TVP38/TMEM64 family protein [Nitrospinota bacterium]
MMKLAPANSRWQKFTAFLLGGNPKKRFKKFIFLILLGLITSYLTIRAGVRLTPENFKDFVVSLGIAGPIIYISVFIIRPLFLIPSIALFIGGGLAFGPIWGPLYASVGAAMGGTVGFWIARKLGHDFVKSKLKFGADVIENTKFNFSVVWLLSLIPVMPVTVINYGAGLSPMKFKNYIVAHVLGLTPRAFAYGFFGSTLLEVGSPRFRWAMLILILLGGITVFYRLRKGKFFSSVSKVFLD